MNEIVMVAGSKRIYFTGDKYLTSYDIENDTWHCDCMHSCFNLGMTKKLCRHAIDCKEMMK